MGAEMHIEIPQNEEGSTQKGGQPEDALQPDLPADPSLT
jgi:hypothetical protein